MARIPPKLVDIVRRAMEVAWGVWGDEGEGVVVVVVEGMDEVDGVEGGEDLEEGEGRMELLAVHAARGGAVLYVALMTRNREAYRTCAL